MDSANNLRWIIGAIAAVLLIGAIWYFFMREDIKVETAEEALEALQAAPDVSAIQVESNPIERVPEVNPVERANPFKYVNPLAP
jgi:hypothetical protein